MSHSASFFFQMVVLLLSCVVERALEVGAGDILRTFLMTFLLFFCLVVKNISTEDENSTFFLFFLPLSFHLFLFLCCKSQCLLTACYASSLSHNFHTFFFLYFCECGGWKLLLDWFCLLFFNHELGCFFFKKLINLLWSSPRFSLRFFPVSKYCCVFCRRTHVLLQFTVHSGSKLRNRAVQSFHARSPMEEKVSSSGLWAFWSKRLS